MRKSLLLILLLPVIAAAQVQTARVITIDSVVKLGLSNSKYLKISTAKVLNAQAKYNEALDAAYPSLSVGGSYQRINNVPVIAADLPPYGFITFIPNIPDNYNLSASGSELLFNGFKLKYSEEAAQLAQKASQMDASTDSAGIILNLQNSYINFYKAVMSKKAVEQSINELNQHLKDAQNLKDNGLATNNDVLKVQLLISNAQITELDLDNNIKIVNYDLNVMLGLNDNTLLEPDTTAAFSLSTDKTFDQVLQQALTTRPELSAADYRNKAALKNLDIARTGILPAISLIGQTDYSDPNRSYFPYVLGFKDNWAVGVNLSWNITNLFINKHNIDDASTMALEAKANYEQLNDQVKMNVNQTYLNYIESQDKIKVAQSAVDQAQENYKELYDRYKNQVASSTDLSDAETLLLQARINYSNTQADAQLAYYQLLNSSGTKIK
jgi:outer membrane protein